MLYLVAVIKVDDSHWWMIWVSFHFRFPSFPYNGIVKRGRKENTDLSAISWEGWKIKWHGF